ncbi:hypothetical protein [Actinomadura madurae]|uniref:hypothetical protein n=2 Tax=Actinomadura madurae TaxID=1993 RepID=UPI0020D25C0C|nr:hypothetical protein [Actinomadura madurae]MCP9983346.1 hypothetical protein [Actinomadura madurae]MCQ0005090.1 hypothetical protein [Actinomadura madurae]MCQ0019597.1 hypothetical protein [Actinomadura madurae]
MTKRPFTVRAAAALEAAEGLAAAGFGVFTGVETAVGAAVDPASAIGVTVLALAGGLGMLACARGLLRADQWSRAPTVLTQLFALPIAWSLWQSDRPAIALPMAVVAVLALIAVLSPPSTAWLVYDHDEDGDEEKDGEGGEPAVPATASKAGKAPASNETDAKEPRSLGQRLKDRLKEQPTKD